MFRGNWRIHMFSLLGGVAFLLAQPGAASSQDILGSNVNGLMSFDFATDYITPRGLHEPSMRVLQAIATALNLSTETLLEHAGVIVHDGNHDGPAGTEAAIRQDPLLTDEQKQALLMIYRSYVQTHDRSTASDNGAAGA